MSVTTSEPVRAKDRRKQERARAFAGGTGGFLPIPTRELRRLLLDWGWREIAGRSSHQYKFSWPVSGDVVLLGEYGDQSARAAVEKIATAMRLPIRYLLEGPTASNPHRARVLGDLNGRRSDRRFDRGDYVDVKHESARELEPERAEVVVDLTTSEEPPVVVDLSTVDPAVSETEVERFVALRERGFLHLEYAERREFLELRRRLITEGLFMPEVDEAVSTSSAPTNGARRTEPLTVSNDVRVNRIEGRRRAIEERRANAPRPGHAKSIEEVLARGEIATAQRRAVLETLVKNGGAFEDRPTGFATSKLGAAMEAAGHDAPGGGLMRAMEADGQIARELNGKRTYRIALVDPLAPKSTNGTHAPEPAAAAPEVVEPAPPKAKRKYVRKAPGTPKRKYVRKAPTASAASAAPSEPAAAPEPVAAPTAALAGNDERPTSGVLLEVKFVDRGGRIFLETDDGRIAVADALRWV